MKSLEFLNNYLRKNFKNRTYKTKNTQKVECNNKNYFGHSDSQFYLSQQQSTTNSTVGNSEIIPWGVQAVWQGEDISKRGNFASDCYAFVIDSGVSDKTGDITLASNPSWHRSWIFGETPFTDGAGHGTHIAGTIGALVNGKGIVGVAPGTQIVSLKVHDSNNSGGSGGTLIEAINYAVSIINDNNLDKNKVVVNMSVSGNFNSELDAAIKNAASQGIKFSIASGNNGRDVDGYTPASAGDHPNVYTVSAVDSNYKMPSWSNWDKIDATDAIDDIDFAAPGVDILSYGSNGTLTTLSGTSMAASHMAGLLLTGGVQAGEMTSPYYTNSADPFAITKTQAYIPRPTYNIICNNTVNEGQTINVDLATTNVTQGTAFYWSISGNGIDSKDFVGTTNFQGSFQTDNAGKASVSFLVKDDITTETNEILKFEMFSDSNRSKKVGEKTITIQDTSKTPPILGMTLWGTIANDNIAGGGGNDIITGIQSIGNSKESMGFGQIDVLTGGSGNDVFVLGDSRGVFYDDRIESNLGTLDYAIIKDFKPGEDKIQSKKGESHTFEFIGGNGYLYLNRNRTTTIEKWGASQEELIAVLEGVNVLKFSDLVLI